VASIKLNNEQAAESGMNFSPGRFMASDVSMKLLLKEAYQVKGFQIIGAPEWTNTQRYDINAVAPVGTSAAGMHAMLQHLLAERFNLSVRRDTQDMRVFTLSVGKTGPKLGQLVSISEGERKSTSNRETFKGQASLAELTDYLSAQLQRVVVDRTGIEGVYNFDFRFVSEARAAKGASDGPSIFTALEGLGLKLQTETAPVPVLHIDRIERNPTEN
jgi:uncharacterized protein (TIGR03435 family)